jgi:hypothetical protein
MSVHRSALRNALLVLIAAATTAQAAPDSPAPLPQAASLFPKIEGWTISDGPTQYTPDTLFEYIDGGADVFLQFDFQELSAATYGHTRIRHDNKRRASRVSDDRAQTPAAAGAEVRVEIYRHRDATRAFGMYSQERPAGTIALPIGVEGYAGADHLELVVGPYYVKLAQLGGKEPSVLVPFAEKVAAGLPGTRAAPAVLKCFPDAGKRARAEKLTARDFLGQSFLHDAVAVPYQIGTSAFRLFVVEGKDAADARTMVARYRMVGKASDAGADALGSEGTTTVKDPLNGEVVLHWKGRWLWGAVDQTCGERKALIDELGRSLSEREKSWR